MDQDVIASLSGSPTAEQQRRNMQYFEELKNSEVGWKLCVQALSMKTYADKEHAQFFCLQVIEFYVRFRYNSDTVANQEALRQFLCQWSNFQTTSPERAFIRNKISQIIALVFVQDYPNRWPNFFVDLLNTLSLGDPAVDHYLRVLKSIALELESTPAAEMARNNSLKDAIRENSVVILVDSWYQILQTFGTRNPAIATSCIEIIGSYVSWIDITLVANERFVPLFVSYLAEPDLREASADCIHDMISKGMDPVLKTKLLEWLDSLLSAAGVWELVGNPLVDSDFIVKLGKIVCGMGVNLIDAYNKIQKNSDPKLSETSGGVLLAVEAKAQHTLEFFANVYDDVSLSVFDFLRDYIHLLKSKRMLSDTDKGFLSKTIQIVCNKVRYDPEYDFEHEGEDEAMFQDYRKQLRIIFDNIALVDKQNVIQHVQMVSTQAFQNWRELQFQDVEAALYLLHMVGETAGLSAGLVQFSPDIENSSALQMLLLVMVNSDVQLHTHSAVVLQYFETVVRYEKFFFCHSDFIVKVLTAFLQNNGMFHPNRKVRSRSAYLFSRFVKSMRAHLTPALTHEILQAIEPLLALSNPSKSADEECVLTDDDQLYLYEVVGIVIVSGEQIPQKKADYMNRVVSPLLETCRTMAARLNAEKDPKLRTSIAQVIVQAISVTGRISKAFSSQDSMKSALCVNTYLEALHTFLRCVETANGEEQVMLQSAVRQYLHRMVVCLEDEVLPYIPVASQALLQNCDCKSIQEYIPLINQVISKFKKEVTPFLQQMFAPMVEKIFENLARPIEPNDEQAIRERQLLQRQYYHFIAAIVTNNLTEVLPAQNAALLNQVMQTVIQGSIEFPDPVAQKACFSILKKLVELWAGQDGPDGFIEFMYEFIVPACFLAPSKSTFDLTDAQTLLVLNETAACLKVVLDKRKEEFIVFLRVHYLPKLDLPNMKIDQYLQAVQGGMREFKLFLKDFFKRGRA